MKSRETALNLKRFEVEDRARKVADIERMIRDFEGMASDLDVQIQAEEDRTGVKDPAHFAYSTFAKSAVQRRDNLRASVQGLRTKLEAAEKDHADAIEQLRAATVSEPREQERTRRRPDRSSGLSMR